MVFGARNLSNPCIMNLQSSSLRVHLRGQNCLILIRSLSSPWFSANRSPTDDTKIGCSVSIVLWRFSHWCCTVGTCCNLDEETNCSWNSWDRFSDLLSIQVTDRRKRLRFYNQSIASEGHRVVMIESSNSGQQAVVFGSNKEVQSR